MFYPPVRKLIIQTLKKTLQNIVRGTIMSPVQHKHC